MAACGELVHDIMEYSCRFFICTDKAIELTERSKGKHHIGDFLPPEELEKFIEKVKAIKEGRNPGEAFNIGGVYYLECDHSFLYCRLFRL